ncbi:short-chain dehydrogenase [Magnetospirillum sp. ME-1]|uniref:SDR family oxidoreductase n=1 Tax=Magnetospirillum sp. ME-1 TaxID=1639348 RepID=UPI000A17DD37|nr:SDR family oxidoreductase [Magnetospirillum sp. ME-1]ARJ67006.1 short-chain dehydrogenase [Magnetospirillum sp. ME-1]
MPTILITGANRGMGLEFARQYAAAGWRVLGTVRDPMAGRALSEAGGEVYVCDVALPDQVARLKSSLAGVELDVLLLNAGIYGENQDFGAVDPAAFMKAVAVNTLAPLKLAEAFADRMTGRKVIAAVSSKMGAMSDNTSGGSYAYRASKAALNMVIKGLAVDLAPKGILTVALSPGWVRTDMGGPNAPLDAAEAVAGMRKVVDALSSEDSGAFIHYDGSRLNW